MVSERYESRRRLALLFAVVSVALLATQFGVAFFFEYYDSPRVTAGPDGITVVHRVARFDGAEGGPGSRLLLADPALQVRRRFPLEGHARAVVAEGDELLAFFETRYSVLRGGDSVRGADLEQAWELRDAVSDPGRNQTWIFGWTGGRIVARQRILGKFTPDIPVLEAAEPERLNASMDGAAGPLVAWRERGSQVVKTALFDGRAWASRGDFDIGASERWSAFLAGDRVLVLHFDREDRAFRTLTLRVRCCAACGRPPPPERIVLRDPVLLLGRQVTGIAAAAAGDRVLLTVSRPTTLQSAWLPADTLRPGEGARLLPLAAEPLWRRLAGFLAPLVLLFFSFSLVFLGFTMLRERNRFVLEKLRPAATDGPRPAAILQRAMAHMLDQMILIPALAVLGEVLNAVPEASPFDPSEPKIWSFWGLLFALHVAYHAVLEGLFGWTVGKRIIGLRVVRRDGSRLGFGRAVLRSLLRPLDGEYPLGVFVGAALLISTPRRQRLGDFAAGTIVVEEAPLNAPSGPI
jgi:uncharacterized RDD family membrane protein YckC